MGYYLNPTNVTKEEWLEVNALPITGIPENHTNGTHTVAVLVENGGFTACALAYNQRELEAFNHPEDFRPKIWFWVPNDKLDAFN